MGYGEASFMHHTSAVVHNYSKGLGVEDFCTSSKKEFGFLFTKINEAAKRNSGPLSLQKMVVNYPWTTWNTGIMGSISIALLDI